MIDATVTVLTGVAVLEAAIAAFLSTRVSRLKKRNKSLQELQAGFDFKEGKLKETIGILRSDAKKEGDMLSEFAVALTSSRAEIDILNKRILSGAGGPRKMVSKSNILKVMDICKGNKTKCSEKLGISRPTLRKLMKEHGI